MGVTGLLNELSSISHTVYLPIHSQIQSTTVHSRTNSTRFVSCNKKHNYNLDNKNDPTKGSVPPPRVAIDVSVWIAKYCHVYGHLLVDERYFHRYGRAELMQITQRQNQEEGLPTSPSLDIVTDGEKLTQDRERQMILKVTEQVLSKILSLRTMHLDVFIVFDGAVPPMKQDTTLQRAKVREVATMEALSFSPPIHSSNSRKCGNNTTMVEVDENDDEEENRDHKRIRLVKRAGAQTTEIYAKIVQQILIQLRHEKVPFLVAPYEADGQLAFLARKGYVDWVVTEDSDLIGYGVPTLIYKFEELTHREDWEYNNEIALKKLQGKKYRGIMIQRCNYGATPSSFSLLGFSDVMIATMLVAAGCDYSDKLVGIGLKTARKVVQKAFSESRIGRKSQDGHARKTFLELVLQGLYEHSYEKNIPVESQKLFESNFLSALVSFRHPVVFDPIRAECVIFNIESPDVELVQYEPYAKIIEDIPTLECIVGKRFSRGVAISIAEGWIDARTGLLRGEKNIIPKNVVAIYQRWTETDVFHSSESLETLNGRTQENKFISIADESDDEEFERKQEFVTQQEQCYLPLSTTLLTTPHLNVQLSSKSTYSQSSSYTSSASKRLGTQTNSQHSQSSSCTLSAELFSSNSTCL